MHAQVEKVQGGNFKCCEGARWKWVAYAAKAIQFPIFVDENGVERDTAEPFKVWLSLLSRMLKERADQHGKQEKLNIHLHIAN